MLVQEKQRNRGAQGCHLVDDFGSTELCFHVVIKQKLKK